MNRSEKMKEKRLVYEAFGVIQDGNNEGLVRMVTLGTRHPCPKSFSE
jgi:hypothetical protein